MEEASFRGEFVQPPQGLCDEGGTLPPAPREEPSRLSSSGPVEPSRAVRQFNILTTIPGGALNRKHPTELLPDSCRLDLWEMMNAGFLFV